MHRNVFFLSFLFLSIQGYNQNLYDRFFAIGNVVGIVEALEDTELISYPHPYFIPPYGTFAFICDKHGNPQFHTNGGKIGTINGDVLISSGMLDSQLGQGWGQRLPIPQGAIILPKNDCQYYCIHYSVTDSLYNINIQQPNILYYVLVDMCANNGRGVVLSAKNPIYQGTMTDSRLTACKHANGRDWWLVAHQYRNNKYLTFLVTPDSISTANIQSIGPVGSEPDAFGQAVFSPDGTKYAAVSGSGPITIMDFDRCNGTFSNPISFNFHYYPPYFDSTLTGGDGCAFSPSGRYLYINSLVQIVQFDTWLDSIASSAILIASKDSTYENQTPFEKEYLAPNGKIYIEYAQGGGQHVNVIHSPDNRGDSCEFQKEYLFINGTNPRPISVMPSYRLGLLVGSGCDTISSISGSLNNVSTLLNVQPNPAHDYVTISLTEYRPNSCLLIYNVDGQLIYKKEMFYLDDYIDVSTWPSGNYFIRMQSDKEEASSILIKQ